MASVSAGLIATIIAMATFTIVFCWGIYRISKH